MKRAWFEVKSWFEVFVLRRKPSLELKVPLERVPTVADLLKKMAAEEEEEWEDE